MASMASPTAPVSWGELLDKIAILEIKHERITAPAALANVAKEYGVLKEVGGGVLRDPEVGALFGALKAVNEELWEIEDAIREEEAAGMFGTRFVRLARSVYKKNDERAALKREINHVLASDLVEEKSYWSAPAVPPSDVSATAGLMPAAR